MDTTTSNTANEEGNLSKEKAGEYIYAPWERDIVSLWVVWCEPTSRKPFYTILEKSLAAVYVVVLVVYVFFAVL